MLKICAVCFLMKLQQFFLYGVAALYLLGGYRRILLLFSILFAAQFDRSATFVITDGVRAFDGMYHSSNKARPSKPSLPNGYIGSGVYQSNTRGEKSFCSNRNQRYYQDVVPFGYGLFQIFEKITVKF